tara:strand:+ start:267 stop:503 length:237 start_codon:yes stop_codon:yes gene_type:complete
MAFITTAKQTNPVAWSVKQAMQKFFKDIGVDANVRIDANIKGLFVEAERFGEEIAVCTKVEDGFAIFNFDSSNVALPI